MPKKPRAQKPVVYENRKARARKEHDRMQCVNLKERFGTRYRITFDPAYVPRDVPRDKLDPWMMQVPGRYGSIYPPGGTKLVVEIDGHSTIKARVGRLDCCEPYQIGEGFGAFLFDAADFNTVAKIIRSHRKRQFSEERRAKLREQMQILNRQTPVNPRLQAPRMHSESRT
jgi:hypothetical protein